MTKKLYIETDKGIVEVPPPNPIIEEIVKEFEERFKIAGTYPMGILKGEEMIDFFRSSLEKALQKQRADLVERVEKILEGIDQEETTYKLGWWETSTGAEFGKKKLSDLIQLLKE